MILASTLLALSQCTQPTITRTSNITDTIYIIDTLSDTITITDTLLDTNVIWYIDTFYISHHDSLNGTPIVHADSIVIDTILDTIYYP